MPGARPRSEKTGTMPRGLQKDVADEVLYARHAAFDYKVPLRTLKNGQFRDGEFIFGKRSSRVFVRAERGTRRPGRRR